MLHVIFSISGNTNTALKQVIEEYSAKRGSSPIWFISSKMAKHDFVYHCWQWLAVTLKWLLHMLWISHHYETFTECRNDDSVAEIDANSIFMIWGLNPLSALYSSIIIISLCDLLNSTLRKVKWEQETEYWHASCWITFRFPLPKHNRKVIFKRVIFTECQKELKYSKMVLPWVISTFYFF